MATGYEAINELQNQTNQLYNQQQEQQNRIINTSTEQAIADIERNKQKTDRELNKTNKVLYTDYQKQINPYGVNAERLAEQGLANSGLAETTKANYYNTYQNARAEATNNANQIKADFDADMVKARQNGDMQKAQSALELYKQKIADLSNFYNLRFNVDQFNYQKERDSVADSQWLKQYNLQKKNSATRSYRSSGSSSKSSSSKTTTNLNNNSNKQNVQEIMKNVVTLQGPGIVNNIKDKSTGKTYASINALLQDYGYAVTK